MKTFDDILRKKLQKQFNARIIKRKILDISDYCLNDS